MLNDSKESLDINEYIDNFRIRLDGPASEQPSELHADHHLVQSDLEIKSTVAKEPCKACDQIQKFVNQQAHTLEDTLPHLSAALSDTDLALKVASVVEGLLKEI